MSRDVFNPAALQHPGLIEWLIGGSRGISSNTIVAVLTGIATDHQSEPLDPDDFQRCERLLRAVPTLRPLLPRMADQSSAWATLVAKWDEIAALIDEEAPGVLDGERWGSAPRAYALMQQCRGVA